MEQMGLDNITNASIGEEFQLQEFKVRRDRVTLSIIIGATLSVEHYMECYLK